MPCRGPEPWEEGYFSWESDPETLIPLLCKAIKILRDHKIDLKGDLFRWAKIHDELDKQREEEERLERHREGTIRKLKKRLTKEERDILGVD